MICQLIRFCRKLRSAITNQLNENSTQNRFLIRFCRKLRFWLIRYHTNQYCFVLFCSFVSERTQQTFEMTKSSEINSAEIASIASIVSVINADIESTKQSVISRYIKKKIKNWNEYDFKNDNFWKIFHNNFENYTEENFDVVNKNDLQRFRSYFKKWNVWMKIKSNIFIIKSLTNILKKTKSIEWTKKKIRNCWKQKKFISNEVLNFIIWLTEKNKIANAVAKSHTSRHDQSYDCRVSFILNSSDLWYQKRTIISKQSKHQQSQQSKQSKHQNENQSDKQSKQQRQQTKKQHQQSVQSQQSRMQSIEQQSFSFDEILFWTFSVFSKSSAFETSKNHDRVLFNLVKMYSNEAKYSDKNDSWNFKFIIFHDMCAKAEVSETIKLMTFSIMFKNFVLNYYYSNVTVWKPALNFVQTCVSISSYFEDAEYKQNVLTKWNAFIFRSVMATSKHQDKSMHECLQLLIKKFRHLQHDLNEEFRIDKFIHNKLITACQEVSACQYVCFKFFDTLVDLINDLQSSIITFSKSHSHSAENYQPDVVYYIDRRYKSRKRFLDDLDQLYDRKKNNFDRTIVSYNLKRYDRKKKRCFICNRIDCWSINHTWKKRDASKTQLKKRFNESFNRFDHQSEKNWKKRIFQYIIKYVIDHEDIDPDAELIDEMKTFTMKINAINDFKDIIFSKSFVFIDQNFYYFEPRNQMDWENQKA